MSATNYTPPPFTKEGSVGSPQQNAFDKTQSAGQSQAALTTGGRRRRRRSSKYLRGGAGEVVVPPVSNAAGIPGVSNQVAETTATSVNSQTAGTNDSLVGNPQPIGVRGGRRRRRSRKIIRRVKKSRKTRKTRRVKKSRNTKKKQ